MQKLGLEIFNSFQLTPSRRATVGSGSGSERAGHFNSRPHGGRPSTTSSCLIHLRFQLTPSRRATKITTESGMFTGISTHALTEGDDPGRYVGPDLIHFNSRPHGGRHETFKVAYNVCISTHALTEGDGCGMTASAHILDFNSRPHGGRPASESFKSRERTFQLTPSRRATALGTGIFRSDHISTHALTEGDQLGY